MTHLTTTQSAKSIISTTKLKLNTADYLIYQTWTNQFHLLEISWNHGLVTKYLPMDLMELELILLLKLLRISGKNMLNQQVYSKLVKSSMEILDMFLDTKEMLLMLLLTIHCILHWKVYSTTKTVCTTLETLSKVKPVHSLM